MAVDENTSSSTGNLQDNLETIDGIGPRTAEALSHVGIHRLEDLAESTPDGLAKALTDGAGLRISPKRIEAMNWTGQAQALLQQAREEQVPPQQNQEAEQKPAETQLEKNTPPGTQWHQHAGFSLFFDYELDEEGKQSWQTRVWQTRVYHDETGAETQFPGIEPHLWVNWILQQADLPVDVESDLIAAETPVSATAVTPNPAQVSILDVQIEPQSSSDVRNSKFVSTIHFTVSGANAKTLTADNTPYQIIVHAVDLGSGVTKLVASGRSQFQPEQSEYIHRLEQPIPDLRRYELQTIVLIQSQPELMTIYRGPTINVTP